MTEDQAVRLLEVAIRRREEMAEQCAALILAAEIENFIPEIARAEFIAWCDSQGR